LRQRIFTERSSVVVDAGMLAAALTEAADEAEQMNGYDQIHGVMT
jgi:hypothetical protein